MNSHYIYCIFLSHGSRWTLRHCRVRIYLCDCDFMIHVDLNKIALMNSVRMENHLLNFDNHALFSKH